MSSKAAPGWWHVVGTGYLEIVQFGDMPKVVLRGYNEASMGSDRKEALGNAADQLMQAGRAKGYDVTGFYWTKEPTAKLIALIPD